MNPSLPTARPVSRAIPGVHARVRTDILEVAAICAAFFAVVDLGVLSDYDGVVLATALAFLQPSRAPCLLVLVISVHDAPGMATPSLYLAVAGVAAGMAINDLCSWRRVRKSAPRSLATLLALAILLAAYGTASSWFNETFAGRHQSADRHFTLIALLIAAMPMIAWLAWRQIVSNPRALPQLRAACICALAHIVLITALEYHYGPLFGTSVNGAAEIVAGAQLVEEGDRGVSRLTGPFLTPNNLAYVPAILLLLLLATSPSDRVTKPFLAAYVLVGGGLAMLGASRSMLLFFIVSTALMCWHRSRALCLLLGGCALVVAFAGFDAAGVRSFGRLDDLSFVGSTRELLWDTVIDDFAWPQWTFGVGLTHWDALFENVYVEDRVSDPHNWLLSITGMFGLLGIVFYLKLGSNLLHAARHGSQPRRVAAWCLLAIYFGRDLMGVQYLLNNHPNACLNWLLLCLLLGGAAASVHQKETVVYAGAGRERRQSAHRPSRAA